MSELQRDTGRRNSLFFLSISQFQLPLTSFNETLDSHIFVSKVTDDAKECPSDLYHSIQSIFWGQFGEKSIDSWHLLGKMNNEDFIYLIAYQNEKDEFTYYVRLSSSFSKLIHLGMTDCQYLKYICTTLPERIL